MKLAKADSILSNTIFPKNDLEKLRFKYLKTRYEITYSRIEIDSGLLEYERIQRICEEEGYSSLNANILGRLANGYRSKRQLGKAYEFNQKEIAAARMSQDSLRMGRALITELDIAYNSLPWPLKTEDLDELVIKGQNAIEFAQNNSLDYIVQYGKLYVSKFYIQQREFLKATALLDEISDRESLSVVFSKYEHLCEIAKLRKDEVAYRKYTLLFKKYAYRTNRPFVALNAHNYLLDYMLDFGSEDSIQFYANMLEKDLMVVDTTKYLDFLDITYTTLAKYYANIDTEKQLKYTEYSASINKTIAKRQREAFLAIELYKKNLKQLESQNIALNESQSIIRKNLKLVIGVSIVLLLLLFLIYKRYQKSRGETANMLKEKEILSESVKQKSIELHNKQRIYLDKLIYIKASRNYVDLFSSERNYLDRSTLTDILQKLPPNFIQVHRSYVINTNFIRSVSGASIILKNGVQIPFSRSFKAKLKDIL